MVKSKENYRYRNVRQSLSPLEKASSQESYHEPRKVVAVTDEQVNSRTSVLIGHRMVAYRNGTTTPVSHCNQSLRQISWGWKTQEGRSHREEEGQRGRTSRGLSPG